MSKLPIDYDLSGEEEWLDVDVDVDENEILYYDIDGAASEAFYDQDDDSSYTVIAGEILNELEEGLGFSFSS